MANIKEVNIRGWLPFHLGDDEKALLWLGRLHTPTQGFRFSWTGGNRYLDNENGGRTSFHQYEIKGREAYWDGGLKDLVQTFNRLGPVHVCYTRDTENKERFADRLQDWTNNDWANGYTTLLPVERGSNNG